MTKLASGARSVNDDGPVVHLVDRRDGAAGAQRAGESAVRAPGDVIGPDDVVGGQLRPVVEHDPVSQADGPEGAVGRDRGRARGEPRNGRQVLIEAVQAVEQE